MDICSVADLALAKWCRDNEGWGKAEDTWLCSLYQVGMVIQKVDGSGWGPLKIVIAHVGNVALLVMDLEEVTLTAESGETLDVLHPVFKSTAVACLEMVFLFDLNDWKVQPCGWFGPMALKLMGVPDDKFVVACPLMVRRKTFW